MSFRIKELCDHDGLSKDVLTQPQTFKYCPACQGQFTLDFLPNLFVCGHLICDECTTQINYCPSCSNKLKVKDKRYKKLIECNKSPSYYQNLNKYTPSYKENLYKSTSKKVDKPTTINLCIWEDGLSNLILTKPEVFYKCTGCLEPFTKQLAPNLLTCGHLLCDMCTKDKNNFLKCPEFNCGKAVAIKKGKYDRLLFANQLMAKNQKLTYNFAVGTMVTSIRQDVNGVPADKTLKQIFSKIRNFQFQVDFDKSGRYSEDHLNIVFGTKTLNYGLNKNKTLSELMLSEKNPIRLHDSTQSLRNAVTIINRERGGMI